VEKSEVHWSENMTFDDYDVKTAAVAAYDAIDVSRPVSQTSLFSGRAPDNVSQIP